MSCLSESESRMSLSHVVRTLDLNGQSARIDPGSSCRGINQMETEIICNVIIKQMCSTNQIKNLRNKTAACFGNTFPQHLK